MENIVRVHRPQLTAEELARRKEKIRQAAARLVQAYRASGN